MPTLAAALDAPKAEVLAGLDRAEKLLPGAGYFEVTAAAAKPWAGGLEAFVRAELGWHPTDNLAAFAFAQADLQGVQGGIGARLSF